MSLKPVLNHFVACPPKHIELRINILSYIMRQMNDELIPVSAGNPESETFPGRKLVGEPFRVLMGEYEDLADRARAAVALAEKITQRFPFLEGLPHDTTDVVAIIPSSPWQDTIFQALVSVQDAELSGVFMLQYRSDWEPFLVVAEHVNPAIFGKSDDRDDDFTGDTDDFDFRYLEWARKGKNNYINRSTRWKNHELDDNQMADLLGLALYGAVLDIATEAEGKYPEPLLEYLESLISRHSLSLPGEETPDEITGS